MEVWKVMKNGSLLVKQLPIWKTFTLIVSKWVELLLLEMLSSCFQNAHLWGYLERSGAGCEFWLWSGWDVFRDVLRRPGPCGVGLDVQTCQPGTLAASRGTESKDFGSLGATAGPLGCANSRGNIFAVFARICIVLYLKIDFDFARTHHALSFGESSCEQNF